MKRRRILFCADGHAIHTQQWLRLFEGTDWDVHAFVGGAVPSCPIEATFHTLDTKAPNPASNRVKPFWPLRRGVARVCQLRYGSGPDVESRRLASLIRKLQPAIVHSLRMQNEGYTVLGALDAIRDVGARWIVSLWGSDLVYFAGQDDHRDRIAAVLQGCDHVMADCVRDLRLSVEYGAAKDKIYFGHAIPGAGGIDLEASRRHVGVADPACRRLVLFPHAREDRFHLFHPMLQAVQLAEASLRRYRLMFVGVNDESRQAINTLPKSLRSHCEMRKQISHDDVYDLLGGSRVVVKPSISDGTPNIMLEAMATGTLPILSPIESIQEWLADGVNGLLAANDDPEALADAMARACEDDVFVRDAASMNSGLIEARADRRGVRKQVLAMYESLWSGEEDPETSRASKELFSEAESCVSW